jgi:ubiquinone/menaquinone biosynthesis C-methylase UbiE
MPGFYNNVKVIVKNEFDIKASDWDKNPVHWERSYAIAGEILKQVPLNAGFIALEFGAGTGILSFLLRNYLKEIILMDNSREMIRIIDEKIIAAGVSNMKTLFLDLENSDYNESKFDFIFTQMALHHVADIDNILRKFHGLLNLGGYLAIADLYPENGSFHGKEFTGHKGFNVNELAHTIHKTGFSDISHKECFVIDRKITDDLTNQYPVFLIIANRK